MQLKFAPSPIDFSAMTVLDYWRKEIESHDQNHHH